MAEDVVCTGCGVELYVPEFYDLRGFPVSAQCRKCQFAWRQGVIDLLGNREEE